VATFTQLGSGNWRVQVRRKTRYVAETFRRRKDGEEWALEMDRNIDRNGSSKPRVVRDVRTFGGLIDLHERRHARSWKAPSPVESRRNPSPVHPHRRSSNDNIHLAKRFGPHGSQSSIQAAR